MADSKEDTEAEIANLLAQLMVAAPSAILTIEGDDGVTKPLRQNDGRFNMAATTEMPAEDSNLSNTPPIAETAALKQNDSTAPILKGQEDGTNADSREDEQIERPDLEKPNLDKIKDSETIEVLSSPQQNSQSTTEKKLVREENDRKNMADMVV